VQNYLKKFVSIPFCISNTKYNVNVKETRKRFPPRHNYNVADSESATISNELWPNSARTRWRLRVANIIYDVLYGGHGGPRMLINFFCKLINNEVFANSQKPVQKLKS